MDPLVPAFVAVLLTSVGDRPAMLAAVLADRHGARAILSGALPALGIGFAVAAWAGTLAAPHLSPHARALLLALALVFAGSTALVPAVLKDRLAGWRLPAPLTALLGMAILAAGDCSQFLVFALTARTPSAVLGAIGGTLAAAVPITVAAVLGEQAWRRLPLRAVRTAGGALLLVSGVFLGLGALRLL